MTISLTNQISTLMVLEMKKVIKRLPWNQYERW